LDRATDLIERIIIIVRAGNAKGRT
jgi:hypothetical protein